jgi:hypothetical protein
MRRQALDKRRAVEIEAVLPMRSSRTERVVNAVVLPADSAGYVREISRLWYDARDKIVAIGEYLAAAKRELPHGEYEAMVERQLPFRAATARKIRAIYDAVQSGTIPREELPGHYTVAYALTVLRPAELQAAHDRRLVRRDVSLIEIRRFCAEFRGSGERRLVLERERRRLRARLSDIEAELGGLNATIEGEATA